MRRRRADRFHGILLMWSQRYAGERLNAFAWSDLGVKIAKEELAGRDARPEHAVGATSSLSPASYDIMTFGVKIFFDVGRQFFGGPSRRFRSSDYGGLVADFLRPVVLTSVEEFSAPGGPDVGPGSTVFHAEKMRGGYASLVRRRPA
jgi:hypothetical protein